MRANVSALVTTLACVTRSLHACSRWGHAVDIASCDYDFPDVLDITYTNSGFITKVSSKDYAERYLLLDKSSFKIYIKDYTFLFTETFHNIFITLD